MLDLACCMQSAVSDAFDVVNSLLQAVTARPFLVGAALEATCAMLENIGTQLRWTAFGGDYVSRHVARKIVHAASCRLSVESDPAAYVGFSMASLAATSADRGGHLQALGLGDQEPAGHLLQMLRVPPLLAPMWACLFAPTLADGRTAEFWRTASAREVGDLVRQSAKRAAAVSPMQLALAGAERRSVKSRAHRSQLRGYGVPGSIAFAPVGI